MFFPPRWEEEEARVLAPAVKNFTSRSRWVTSVVQVLYRTSKHSAVRFCLFIGSKSTGLQTTIVHICEGKHGLVTQSFGGRTTAHAPVA